MDYTIILIIFLVEELCGWCWGRDIVRLIICRWWCYVQGYFGNVNGEWKYRSGQRVVFDMQVVTIADAVVLEGPGSVETLKWSHGTESEHLGHSSPYKVYITKSSWKKFISVKVIRWCICTFLLWFHNHYMYGLHSQKAEMVWN